MKRLEPTHSSPLEEVAMSEDPDIRATTVVYSPKGDQDTDQLTLRVAGEHEERFAHCDLIDGWPVVRLRRRRELSVIVRVLRLVA